MVDADIQTRTSSRVEHGTRRYLRCPLCLVYPACMELNHHLIFQHKLKEGSKLFKRYMTKAQKGPPNFAGPVARTGAVHKWLDKWEHKLQTKRGGSIRRKRAIADAFLVRSILRSMVGSDYLPSSVLFNLDYIVDRGGWVQRFLSGQLESYRRRKHNASSLKRKIRCLCVFLKSVLRKPKCTKDVEHKVDRLNVVIAFLRKLSKDLLVLPDCQQASSACGSSTCTDVSASVDIVSALPPIVPARVSANDICSWYTGTPPSKANAAKCVLNIPFTSRAQAQERLKAQMELVEKMRAQLPIEEHQLTHFIDQFYRFNSDCDFAMKNLLPKISVDVVVSPTKSARKRTKTLNNKTKNMPPTEKAVVSLPKMPVLEEESHPIYTIDSDTDDDDQPPSLAIAVTPTKNVQKDQSPKLIRNDSLRPGKNPKRQKKASH